MNEWARECVSGCVCERVRVCARLGVNVELQQLLNYKITSEGRYIYYTSTKLSTKKMFPTSEVLKKISKKDLENKKGRFANNM